jgi:hypothetical protein
MATIVGASAFGNVDSLNLRITNTLRGQKVNINSLTGYVIDIDGTLYRNSDTNTINVVGGIDQFVNQKNRTENNGFYISEPQKRTLYSIMRHLSVQSDNIRFSCENSHTLYAIAAGAYTNFCG